MNVLHRSRFFVALIALLSTVQVVAADESPAPEKTVAALADGKEADGKEEVRIVCFGDSITGVYYHTGGRRAYTDMLGIALARTYPNAKIKMINAGISGHTTVNALARIQKDVLDHAPQLVTIKFGMNDVTRVPIDQFRSNLVQIIDLCQKAGAEVVLCTPNSVLETPSRPSAKLMEYCDQIRQVATERKLPLADIYRAYEEVRNKDPQDFLMLMSDEIHPNMDGHELIASTIARAITGNDLSLDDVQPPAPALPKMIELLAAKADIAILAMPPLDQEIQPILQELGYENKITVTPWTPKANGIQDYADIAARSRELKPNLALFHVPADVSADNNETLIRTFSRVLSYSLSFGYQEWDFVAVAPAVFKPELTDEEKARAQILTTLIRASDLNLIERPADDMRSANEIIAAWFSEQLKTTGRR